MKSKKAEQTAQTLTNIRRAALGLFNERGTTGVHTHDIAKEAGISPGNLYYHYKNKEQIVRDLFLEIEIYGERFWRERAPGAGQGGFAEFIELFFGSLTRYRFFFREFSILLQKDEELSALWRSRYEALFEAMKGAAGSWADAGIMKPWSDEKEVSAFIDGAWIVMNFSAGFLEAKDGSSPRKTHDKCVELVLRFLLPYHTTKGRREISRYLRSFRSQRV